MTRIIEQRVTSAGLVLPGAAQDECSVRSPHAFACEVPDEPNGAGIYPSRAMFGWTPEYPWTECVPTAKERYC